MKLHLYWRVFVCFLAVSGLALSASAQVPVSSVSGKSAVIAGERVSTWLLRNVEPGADLTALQWRVSSERVLQQRLRSAVIESLGTMPVASLLSRLPMTGRLSLAHPDAHWLEAAMQEDPVLGMGDTLQLFPRPTLLAVLNEGGDICLVPHRPGALARDYLQACAGSLADDQVDVAWIAQPDGRVSLAGVAAWSAEAQDEPGPGAWLWSPARRAHISKATSGNVARLLATQAPPDNLLPELGLTPRSVQWPASWTPSPVPRNLPLSSSDWGEVGLLQTPSARMESAGAVRLRISAGWPYTQATSMLQPLDWLEMGFRYTDIENQLYGASIAGSQTYKDKSLDLKLRLLEEDGNIPQLALGMRDIGGTGLFSGEYLVASKRWGNWDASAGLGWGYMGGRGNIASPLGFLGNSYKSRGTADVGQGGAVNSNGMFHGPVAPFGGVQWNSPYQNWVFKAELDGNDYRNEPFGTNLQASSPFNWGLVYRYSPSVDLSLAWERGDRVVFGLNLHGSMDKMEVPKVLDPVLPRVQPLPTVAPTVVVSSPPASAQSWSSTAQQITRYTDWQVLEIDQQFSTLTLTLATDDAVFVNERVERAITVLHSMAPLTVKRFVLNLQQRGIAMSRVEVDRSEWVAQHTGAQAPSLRLPSKQLSPGSLPQTVARDMPAYEASGQGNTKLTIGPSYNQILGGPDSFLLYEIGVQAHIDKHFTPSTWLAGNFNARLLDNYEGFKYDAPSNLPRVRTYAREFVTTARFTMPGMQLTHVEDLGGGHYASVYGGMLEDMYGGFGAEWLYRPWKGKLAFGMDINHVQQRDFAENLKFRDYQVDTGHATLYWDTGWNDVQVKLSAGQYLAGDVGATFDFKRVFKNGTALGVWATKTNVSAEQFGEGSFDKGIYMSIPFDVLLPKSAPGTANVVWSPLTRDGGAKLNRSVSLFDFTSQRDARSWSQSSRPSRSENRFVSAQDNSTVEPEAGENLWQYTGSSSSALGRGIAGVPASTWAWGGALILGSSLLDNKLDQWALNHQGGNWDRAAAITNGLPLALAAGTGILFTGIAGDDSAATAKTSLTAAAYTMGGNLLTKYAVGRARPADELGNGSFTGLTPSAAQSSFGSNHVALAFALVTPFAKQSDSPWLYGLAASTAVGRIQSREHWLSDTVAGGLLGYAIGSLTYEQQRGGKRTVRLSATPQSVDASWSF